MASHHCLASFWRQTNIKISRDLASRLPEALSQEGGVKAAKGSPRTSQTYQPEGRRLRAHQPAIAQWTYSSPHFNYLPSLGLRLVIHPAAATTSSRLVGTDWEPTGSRHGTDREHGARRSGKQEAWVLFVHALQADWLSERIRRPPFFQYNP